jgi:hypothetical protein
MGMRVDDPRDDGLTRQVDSCRVRAGHLKHPITLPDRQNPSITQSDGLNDGDGRLIAIHGHHLAVVQNRIGVTKYLRRQVLGLNGPNTGIENEQKAHQSEV